MNIRKKNPSIWRSLFREMNYVTCVQSKQVLSVKPKVTYWSHTHSPSTLIQPSELSILTSSQYLSSRVFCIKVNLFCFLSRGLIILLTTYCIFLKIWINVFKTNERTAWYTLWVVLTVHRVIQLQNTLEGFCNVAAQLIFKVLGYLLSKFINLAL